jgi:hypothetical protein
MGIVEDPESPAPSLQASWFLDLSGPEPFARTMLRYWCDLLNDEFTDALIDAFGGDAFALADWMMRTCIPQNPEQLPDDMNSQALARWSEFLFVLRGHLIVALSVMPPGYWHRMDHLANWFTTVYRRVTWQIGRSWTQIEEFPDQYLPVSSVDVHPDLEPAVQSALETLFRGLLQVVGAVRFDSSEKLFMINPEALRSFGDHDLASSPHLEAAEAYLGDMVKPLKVLLPAFADIEDRVTELIAAHFGLDFSDYTPIKHADMRALATEKRDLMPHSVEPWSYLAGFTPLPDTIQPLSPNEAKQQFLHQWQTLVQGA